MYLNNARVTIQGTNRSTFTNEFGEFRFNNVPPGKVALDVFYTGLIPRTVTIELPAGQMVEQRIRLSSANETTSSDDQVLQLDQFVVSSSRETNAASIAANEQRFAPNIKNVVSAEAFGDVTEGNVGEFIKYLPGISVDYVAADVRTISVRGMPDNFTTVNVDGAQMASAASSGDNRTFELEQVSINNVSRVEVAKVPTPDMPATSLGGSVNLVSRSAFERDRASLSYKAYLSISDENTRLLSKTPGPGNESSFKALPGFEFSYVNPVSDTFGFVVNGLSSNQFNEQHRYAPTYRTRPVSTTFTTPYLRNVQVQDGPKNTYRDSIGFKVDWKPMPNHVISAGYQFNYYKSFFGNRNINWNVGTASTPTAVGTAPAANLEVGDNFVHSATGRGAVTIGTSFRDKLGATNAANLGWRYTGQAVQMDAGANYSRSKNWYRDTGRGHFDTVLLEMQGESRVLYDNLRSDGPPDITVLNSAGAVLDSHDLSNYLIRNNLDAIRSRPMDSYDEVTGARFNLKYTFSTGVPLAFKTGASISRQVRDVVREDNRWRYIGPDGIAGSGDERADTFLDTSYYGQDPGWGMRDIEWIDPFALYDYFVAKPGQFQSDVTGNQTRRIQNSWKLIEWVTAGYAAFETRLFENRLNLLGGVRYELTEDFGKGDLFLQNSGVRIERGASAENEYDGFYPSLHATFNVTDNFAIRAAYARTFGRPNFSNIKPGVTINENENFGLAGGGDYAGTLNVRNSALEPWQANAYDLRFEYYMRNGYVAVGGYRKEIDGVFRSVRRPVTATDLAPYGFGQEYLSQPWEWISTENGRDAKISGVEFELSQRLTFLGEFGRMFAVTGNVTQQRISGVSADDFDRWVPRAWNIAVSFDRKPISLQLKWNYRGPMRRGKSTSGDLPVSIADNPATPQFEYDPVNQGFVGMESQLFLDFNFDYKFSKNMSFFVSGRNILDEPHVQVLYNRTTPEAYRRNRLETFGVQWATGFKGSF